MSAWLIAFVGVIYTFVAANEALKGNWGMCIVYSGYAFSNVGLWRMAL